MPNPIDSVEAAKNVMASTHLASDYKHSKAMALALIAIAEVLVDWSSWGPSRVAVDPNSA